MPGVRRAIRAPLGSRQVARVIYGTIIGLALVVALGEHPPGPGIVAGSLLVTVPVCSSGRKLCVSHLLPPSSGCTLRPPPRSHDRLKRGKGAGLTVSVVRTGVA